MRLETNLTTLLGIQFPIIQAPMAGGATTPELVAAVSNSGGLGSLGAGYMDSEEIRLSIKKIRTLTKKPFAVNLFIPQEHHATSKEMGRACELVEQSCQELHVRINLVEPPFAPSFDEQMRVICEEKIPVFSFTFGMLDEQWASILRKNGTILIGNATNIAEACLLEKSKVDALVVQGSEAGGHRGTFVGRAEDALIPLSSVLTQVLKQIEIPVVAAGGIMDAKGIVASLTHGAAAVQIGTAFLTCVESGIPSAYKEALITATKDNTSLTRAFSGKLARGINNLFIERLSKHPKAILNYPIQNSLTRPMRKEAEKQNNINFMSMWAGQGMYLSKERFAADFIKELVHEVRMSRPPEQLTS